MTAPIVVGHDDPYKAEEVRLKLRKLHSEYLLDLEDVVVAVKDEKGKVKALGWEFSKVFVNSASKLRDI